ncbi:hypothetical protein TNCV_4914261 [Trichonephila clavipes]|nr:hypothetical protein TNCV_4914261 [Trichonephila clavipes]
MDITSLKSELFDETHPPFADEVFRMRIFSCVKQNPLPIVGSFSCFKHQEELSKQRDVADEYSFAKINT